MLWICDQSSVDKMGDVLDIVEQHLHSTQIFCVSHTSLPGSDRNLGGDKPGASTPSDQKDVPYFMIWCTIEFGRNKEECFKWWCLFFQVVVTFPGMAEQLPEHGKQWINSLLFFCCMHGFCCSYETVFISIHEFSHFCPSRSLPITLGKSDQAAVWSQLPAGVNP